MTWVAQAPANIALIKYMGKKEGTANLPDNSSLSYTLNHLLTTVSLEMSALYQDTWQPLETPAQQDFTLTAASQARYLQHLERIKKHYAYEGKFLVRSNNNFPHGSGLASSASSFAALTMVACQALSELTGKPLPSLSEQAELSRQGSGSSCRSFYAPWVLWENEEVKPIELPFAELFHQVIVISAQEKKVSSSEAHKRVKSSFLYQGRNERAETRLRSLLQALNTKNWTSAYDICWSEFQDMHHLFSTCNEPFEYINEESIAILLKLQNYWDTHGDGPLVTMDAGPNIHLLYRLDQRDQAAQIHKEYLAGSYHVL